MIMKISKNKKVLLVYEFFITLLALIAVILTFLDLTEKISIESSYILKSVDTSILLIFCVDYFSRLFISKNKSKFIKNNILDLIAIIPFNSFFRVLRITKFFRLIKLSRAMKITKFSKVVRIVRLVAFSKKIKNRIMKFLKTNGFIYVVYITITTIILGAIGIYLVEKGHTIKNFGDAIWWSFVTTTTVGYGDISPVTGLGRIIASILMIIGIGFIGMLTGTIATYFINRKNKENTNQIRNQIIDLSDLSEKGYEDVLNFIEFVKSRE